MILTRATADELVESREASAREARSERDPVARDVLRAYVALLDAEIARRGIRLVVARGASG